MHKTQIYITKSFDDALKQQISASFHNDYVEGVANSNVWFCTYHNTQSTISPIQFKWNHHYQINVGFHQHPGHTILSLQSHNQVFIKIYKGLKIADAVNIPFANA